MFFKKVFFLLLLLLVTNVFAKFDESHQQFTNLLKGFTKIKNNQTLVNYKSLKKNKKQLNKYLNELEKISKKEFSDFSDNTKLAFWINAYNAYTLEIVLRNYPVKSIKDINSGSFLSSIMNSGPWDKKFIELMGMTLSLNDIEHQIIRKDFQEPRIHFAVNCASIGCPSLLREAFVANKLNEQLDVAAKNFITNQNKNILKDDTLFLSRIFDWYGDDFKKIGGYKKFIKKYIPYKGNPKIRFNEYNWKLNEF